MTSGRGFVEFVYEHQDCNEGGVVLDEIDKLNKRQQQVLNNFLESGNIDYQTGKTKFHFSLPKCKVIATTNSIERLAKPFLSRFGEPIHIPPYTFDEFQEISIRLLGSKYNIPIEIAMAIADVAWNNRNIKNVRILEHVGSRIRKDDRAEDIEKL